MRYRKYVIVALCVLIIAAGALFFRMTLIPASSNAAASATFSAIRTASVPTPTPTLPKPAHWRTLRTFTGSGNQSTATFTVSLQWRLSWRCKGFNDAVGQIGMLPHNKSNSVIKDFASGTCQIGGETVGHLDEIGAGTYWLEIIADGGGWTVSVQVPG
jgi:hypothetical protein